MNALRQNHLLVAAGLFAVALILYFLGLKFGAVVLGVLGAVVEVAAWVALARDRSEGSFPKVDASKVADGERAI